MKTFIFLMHLIAILTCVNSYAMDQKITSPQSDVSQIVNLINEHAAKEHTKIVILPKLFRKSAIQNSAQHGELYCAKNSSGEIVAFKKLYILTNENKFNEIALNEIRCNGINSCLVDAHSINNTNEKKIFNQSKIPSFNFKDSCIIYLGSDYTVPGCRQQGLNSQITKYAFANIETNALNSIKTNLLHHIILFYGVTKENAGETGSDSVDRSPSIIKAFRLFINNIALKSDFNATSDLYHIRYKAFMPTFDPEATECKPLPDDQAIPGYGNVVIFPLTT